MLLATLSLPVLGLEVSVGCRRVDADDPTPPPPPPNLYRLGRLALAAYERARPTGAPQWEELDTLTQRRLVAACIRIARAA